MEKHNFSFDEASHHLPGKVLVLDDDEDVLEYVATVLGRQFSVSMHRDPTTIEEALEKVQPSTLILDYRMPGRNGFEVTDDLRKQSKYDMMSIVILSGIDTDEARLQAYNSGADDFIAKPFDASELRAKIEVWTRLAQRSRSLATRSSHFKEMALHDALTGLVSRRNVLEILDNEVKRFHRYHESFCVLMVDLDDFKLINDDYGHAAGDEALKAAAKFLSDSLREIDTVARYGGDEFLIILPNTDTQEAEAVCRKISEAEVYASLRADQSERLSFSIGGAEARGDVLSATTIIDEADMAMLTAKKKGKGGFFLAREGTTSLKMLDSLQSKRETTRDAVCRIMGNFIEEVHRRSDLVCTHTRLVIELSLALAKESGLAIRECQTLRNAARLLPCVDVGMPQEMPTFEAMHHERWRSVYVDIFSRNVELIEQGKILSAEAELLRSLTEQFDGTGAPTGLAGDAIPLSSAILCLVWHFAKLRHANYADAGLPTKEVLDRMRTQSGTVYAPDLFERFCTLIQKHPELCSPPPQGYVFVIDDNPNFGEVLTRQLTWDGHEVFFASTPEEALNHCTDHQWDAVLLDLKLGEEDGLALYQKIRNRVGGDLPAAILSASVDPERIEQARMIGIKAYLRKPAKAEDLTTVIGNLTTRTPMEFQVFSR